jgi:hypothetical protein
MVSVVRPQKPRLWCIENRRPGVWDRTHICMGLRHEIYVFNSIDLPWGVLRVDAASCCAVRTNPACAIRTARRICGWRTACAGLVMKAHWKALQLEARGALGVVKGAGSVIHAG